MGLDGPEAGRIGTGVLHPGARRTGAYGGRVVAEAPEGRGHVAGGLTGLTALVTGSVHGLGRQVVRCLGRDGARVAVNYRESRSDAEALCAELSEAGVESLTLGGDLASAAEAAGLVQEVLGRWGQLDLLVLAAGPFVTRREPVMRADHGAASWHAMAAGNVEGSVAAIAEALPGMRERGFGRIVTFGFDRIGDMPGWPGRAAYAAAKSALWSYTRTLALEESRHGITANMVAPGNITDPFKEGTIAGARSRPTSGHVAPVGRAGTGEDIARVVRFLVDRDSDFVTGSVIYVTGGEPVVREGPVPGDD